MKNLKLNVLAAESIGVATLVCTVVGSGIMGVNLTQDSTIVLLINAIATVSVLSVLITIIGPISGAHLNPVVSLVELLRGQVSKIQFVNYVIAQILGGIVGALVANLMFNLEILQISTNSRVSGGSLIGEIIATAGLVTIIGILTSTNRANLISNMVPLWIGAAIFFTSSTSFANPAVTIARIFTDTFSGISPSSVVPFIIAQLIGGLIGFQIFKSVSKNRK